MAFAELWVGEASPPGRPRGIPRGAADPARGGDALLDQDLDRLLEALRRQPAWVPPATRASWSRCSA